MEKSFNQKWESSSTVLIPGLNHNQVLFRVINQIQPTQEAGGLGTRTKKNIHINVKQVHIRILDQFYIDNKNQRKIH